MITEEIFHTLHISFFISWSIKNHFILDYSPDFFTVYLLANVS